MDQALGSAAEQGQSLGDGVQGGGRQVLVHTDGLRWGLGDPSRGAWSGAWRGAGHGLGPLDEHALLGREEQEVRV